VGDDAGAHGLSRADRLLHAMARDGARCVWCRCELSARFGRPTLEHVVPKVKGGPAWPENEVAACGRCNRTRGHLAPDAWLRVCEVERGLTPDRGAIVGSLRRLDAAIAARGGQRRARPYVARQLQRLSG
jgi:hypothetical protein